MNTRAFTLSLIIALAAMYMVYAYVETKEAEFKVKFGGDAAVLVAKEDIKELDLIDDSKVEVKQVPKNFVAPQALTNVKDVENTMATVPILKGEQITKPRVTYPGVKTGLSRQISLGKRAVSITVSETQAVARLIKPGDRVDVMAIVKYAGGRKDKMKMKTILQDVLVLSTGMVMSNNIPMVGIETSKEVKAMKLNTWTNYNTVTLEVDPFDAQKIMFMLGVGGAQLFMSLRNNDDKEIKRVTSTTIFDVLGDDAAEAKDYFAKEDAASAAGGGGGGR